MIEAVLFLSGSCLAVALFSMLHTRAVIAGLHESQESISRHLFAANESLQAANISSQKLLRELDRVEGEVDGRVTELEQRVNRLNARSIMPNKFRA